MTDGCWETWQSRMKGPKLGCLKYRLPPAGGLSWRFAVFVYTFEEVDLDERAKLCSRYANVDRVVLFRL